MVADLPLMDPQLAERATKMAQMWATDPERLANLLMNEMTTEEWSEICQWLAKSIKANIDDSVTAEFAKREYAISVGMITGIVVERVFQPVAEAMVRREVVPTNDFYIDPARAA